MNNAWRARLALAALATVTFVACSDGLTRTAGTPAPEASPTRPPPSTPPPLPPAVTTPAATSSKPFEFYFGRLVPADQQVLIRSSLELTATYLERSAGIAAVPSQVVTVEDVASLEAARSQLGPESANLPLDLIARRLQFISAEAYLDNIFISTSSPYWLRLDDAARMRAVSHEYFHVVQMWLIGRREAERIFSTPPNQERLEGPSWLFEGSAEYVSLRFAESVGVGDVEDAIDTTSRHPVSELRDLETYVDFVGDQDRLRISLRAIALLLEDRNESHLATFYRLIGLGMTWREAFRFIFGRPIEAFYEEYRQLYG